MDYRAFLPSKDSRGKATYSGFRAKVNPGTQAFYTQGSGIDDSNSTKLQSQRATDVLPLLR